MSRSVWPRITRLALLALALLTPSAAAAAGDMESDLLARKVKAAVLFNLAKFVTWPADKLSADGAPLRLCVLQPDPFGGTLVEATRGKVVNGHPLQVAIVSQADELRSCHVAYTTERTESRLQSTVAALVGSSVLVVHEHELTMRDGSIRMYISNNKVRFEINAAQTERERLQLSSKLLGLSDVVRH